MQNYMSSQAQGTFLGRNTKNMQQTLYFFETQVLVEEKAYE